jgi:hypothetical protein
MVALAVAILPAECARGGRQQAGSSSPVPVHTAPTNERALPAVPGPTYTNVLAEALEAAPRGLRKGVLEVPMPDGETDNQSLDVNPGRRVAPGGTAQIHMGSPS